MGMGFESFGPAGVANLRVRVGAMAVSNRFSTRALVDYAPNSLGAKYSRRQPESVSQT